MKNKTTEVATNESTEVSVIGTQYVLPIDANFADAMVEEMDGLVVSFGRIKIPSGGGLAFEVPGDDPKSPDVVKVITGIIVDHHPVNAYYKDAYTGGNEPPNCSSPDGVWGSGVPGGECAACPYNKFGSGKDGNGKACQNRRRVYILTKDSIFPLLLTLPATSLRAFGDFIAKQVVAKGIRSTGLEVNISLEKDKNEGGIEYSKAVFAAGNKLSKADATALAEYSAGLKATTRKVGVDESFHSEPIEADEDDLPFK